MKSNLKRLRKEAGMTMDNQIRFCRENEELSQAQLADLAGISISHMCMLESGKRTPSLDLAFKLSSILGEEIKHIWLYNK